MASSSLVDFYNSRVNLDKLNPLIRSAYNNTSDFEEYKRNLLAKADNDNRDGDVSFLGTLEQTRREQRVRLARVEHDYYNQKTSPVAFDLPYYAQEEQQTVITTKPPLPTASRRSPSPVFLTEERAHHHIHRHQPESVNVVRRHDDEIAFCPHRTCGANVNTTTVDDLSTSHVKKQIHSMWNEFELDDFVDETKSRRRPPSTAASWAGRVTVPEPFSLTNSMTLDNVHRRKCMHEIEAAKLQKEVDEELNLHRPFKAKPVPAHVHMPLYEQLQEEQRVRREEVRNMTKEYLASTSKPFGFDARERAKSILRRHSYSGSDTVRQEPQFRAKPVPDFYYRTSTEVEQMKEHSLYRSIKKQMRAKEMLRQSRLPSSMHERQTRAKRERRSMSASDLARLGRDEYTFKPKTNGYYIPNYDKLHAQFTRNVEQAKRTRPPTQCKPFLLYTNLIPSKKEKVLDDIRRDQELRHSQTFQIKGKQMATKSKSVTNLSASLQQPEAIPTKMTESQRLREAIGKKKRREDEARTKFEQNFQQSRAAKERRLREAIRDRAKLQDQSVVHKRKTEQKARTIRQSMRRAEDDYATKLDRMHERVERRPLLLEGQRDKAVRELERKIQHAMRVANISEEELMRQRFNPPDVKVTATRSVNSS